MKKKIGLILMIGGLVALIYTGANYLNDTESFQFLGADFVVSKGNITPPIISAVVMVIGYLVLQTKRL